MTINIAPRVCILVVLNHSHYSAALNSLSNLELWLFLGKEPQAMSQDSDFAPPPHNLFCYLHWHCLPCLPPADLKFKYFTGYFPILCKNKFAIISPFFILSPLSNCPSLRPKWQKQTPNTYHPRPRRWFFPLVRAQPHRQIYDCYTTTTSTM